METHEIDYNGNYVILSDIHGNYLAMEACINDAINTYGKSIKGFIFLGDYACDYPNGHKVVDLILKLKEKIPCYIISGNRETGMVKHFYEKTKDLEDPIDLETAEKLTGWSLDTSMGTPLVDCCKLSKEQLAFLATLPETIVLKNQKQTILLKHKMPLNEEEIAFLKAESEKKITTENGEVSRETIVLVGHTHNLSDGLYDFIKQFNPGAIGLSDTGVPGAYYGILNHGKLLNKHVEYDYQKLIEELENETTLFDRCDNWGEFLKLSIITGLNVTVIYINESKRLVEEFQNLDETVAKQFVNLPQEDAIELGKMIFAPLALEEETPFRGRYGNTNPFGDFVKTNILVHDPKTNEVENKTVYDITSEDVIPPTRKPKNNEVEVPQKVLNIIAREYTKEYLDYIISNHPEYFVNKYRWR